MKIQIDLKSAVCGLIIGLAAMFVMGADSSSSNEAGRYQVSSGTSVAVIVDTKTGRSWVYAAATQNRSDENFFNPKTQ